MFTCFQILLLFHPFLKQILKMKLKTKRNQEVYLQCKRMFSLKRVADFTLR